MFGLLKRLWRDRRGNALVIAGAAMPLIVGSAGLASDTIQWTLWKRQLQRLADSGAEAGVYAKMLGNTVDNCSNVSTATYSSPVAYSIKNSNHLPQTPTCTATNPPSTGSYASDTYAVKVDVSMQRRLGFSGMFLSTTPTISASATATVVPSGKYCVVSLESTATTGITASGSASVDLGCGMITNSTSLSAAVATGSSSVTATPIAAVGGISASNNWGSGTVLQPFSIAQADPFASVYPPSATDYPTQNCPNLSVNSNQSKSSFTQNADYRAMGGTFAGAMCFGSLTLNGNVSFPNGSIIILDAGSLSIGSQAHVSCSGCTFVLTSRTAGTNPQSIGNVNINGGATVNLTAPGTSSTGIASNFKGIMFYQDRRAQYSTNANQTDLINGNSNSVYQGAFYFPSQQVTFNGTAGMQTNCMQLVARDVTYSGNMSISNSCPADSGSGAFDGKKVRLVA